MMYLERSHYYAKPGKLEDVRIARERACELRIAMGLARGKVLYKVDPDDDGPDVTWECEFETISHHDVDLEARASDAGFQAAREHMGTLIDRFERHFVQRADADGSTSLAGHPVSGREVDFMSGANRLTGYLHLPPGNGPFPCIVDNHGSQTPPGSFDVSHPQTAAVMMAWGYAYFFPNRAGYGNSDGTPLTQEVTAERGTASHDDQITARLGRECDDVIAALDCLQDQDGIDGGRIAVMGASLGGILSLLASARDDRWACVLDFSGGASQWEKHPKCRTMILDAARSIHAPAFLIQPENDFNTAPTREIADLLSGLGKPYEAMIFPEWGVNGPEAHRFASAGAQIWGPHVRPFLARYL